MYSPALTDFTFMVKVRKLMQLCMFQTMITVDTVGLILTFMPFSCFIYAVIEFANFCEILMFRWNSADFRTGQ